MNIPSDIIAELEAEKKYNDLESEYLQLEKELRVIRNWIRASEKIASLADQKDDLDTMDRADDFAKRFTALEAKKLPRFQHLKLYLNK